MSALPTRHILVMCVGNSCRSQMTGAILRALAGDKVQIHTAGFKPSRALQPMAIQALNEIGIDIESMYENPKSYTSFSGYKFDHLLFASGPAEGAPEAVLPLAYHHEFWDFEDPGHFPGDEEAKMQRHRVVRDLIYTKVKEWLNIQGII